jgi:hypothetical protein
VILYMLMQAVPKDTSGFAPFFPNTLEGWLKIILVYGVSTAATLAAVWRMMKKPLEININGLGDRVGKIEILQAGTETELRKINDTERDAAIQRNYLREQLGETKALAARTSEEVTDIKVDIIGHVTQSRDAVLADVAKVRDEVTSVRERVVRVETTIDHSKQRSGDR